MSKVLILGGDSDYNLGDAAILAALCARFAADGVGEIIVTSGRPGAALPSGATSMIPRGIGGLAQQLQAAHSADLVVIGGGGLLQDDDSRIKMPYWASRVATLRLANRNLAGHSVGAGPLKHPESRIAAGFICSALASITVRDCFAKTALAACTHRRVDVVPDPAFMLAPAPPSAADTLLGSLGIVSGSPVIGMSLRKWFHRRGGFIPSRARASMGLHAGSGQAALTRFLERLAAAIAPVARQLGASILLLPTYSAPYENDAAICAEFARALRGCEIRMVRIGDPALYKAVTGRLSVLISSRMHPLILAAGMGTPIVGLAYNGKFEGMFDMLGIPRRMIWLEQIAEDLPATLARLVDDAIHADDELQQRAARLADTVREKTTALLHQGPALARAA